MEHCIAFGGATERAAELRRQFLRGGADPTALRFGAPEGADVYVHVLGEDAEALRRAHRAGVRVIATSAPELGAVVRAVAKRLDESGAPLAARVPILREAVCERLVSVHARRAALMPGGGGVLALSPLVLGIAEAYGEETDGLARLPELAAALGAGYAVQTLGRQLRETAPVVGRLVEAAVAYAGTRAIGEAVKLRFARGTSAAPLTGSTLPRAAAVPAAP